MALETGSQILDTQDVTPEAAHASNVLDATHAILAALNCPPKVRPMMGAILAMTAGRSTTISFYRADLARRLYGNPRGLQDVELERGCAKVTRLLGRMSEWIDAESLGAVLQYTHGTKDAPGHIKTPIVLWVADLAAAADAELSPTADDRERRAYFRKSTREMVGKRLRKDGSGKSTSDRLRKEKRNASSMLKLGLGFLRSYAKSASFSEDVEAVSAMLHYQIDGLIESLCAENRREETALATPKKEQDFAIESGQEEQEDAKFSTQKDIRSCAENCGQEEQEDGAWGGEADVVHPDVPPIATHRAQAHDAVVDNLAQRQAMPSSPDVVEDSKPIAPPHAPHLSVDVASILAAASGRTEEHWRALYAAASVGSVPTAVCIGGNGERGSGRQGWTIGEGDTHGRMSIDGFIRRFDELIARARRSGHSLIITYDAPLLVRDDCSADDVERLADLAAFTCETSPGSYHVWLAVADIQTKPQMDAFHQALTARGIGGNGQPCRSGRMPGTLNAKRGCDVRLVSSSPGRVLTREHLRDLGVVLPAAPAEPLPTHRGAHQKPMAGNLAHVRGASWRTWPSYDKAIFAKDGDRSAADASFFRVSWMRGFDVEEIADKLVSVSERAQQRGRRAIGQELQHLVKGTR